MDYGSMTVWLYKTMRVWGYEYRQYECMGIWNVICERIDYGSMYENMKLWMYNSMRVWKYDSMGVWVYECMEV